MSDMIRAWRDWVAFHRSNGFEMEHFLNAPADPVALDALESAIGYRLPEDLRILWSIADGQKDIFDIEDASPGTILSPVFGSYLLISVEKALETYRMLEEVASDHPDLDDSITIRGDDPVHASSWRPGWLPISEDGGGNHHAVDLDPAQGGTYGQIILIGRDEDERRVLAPSLSTWLISAAERVPELNDDGDDDVAYFDMLQD